MNKKTIVIVGASRGIGFELVKYFANSSENTVYALTRNIDALTELSTLSNVKIFAFDLESEILEHDLRNIFSATNQIDILINNAGKLVNKPFEDLTRKEIQSSYQVNVLGVMETVQALIPKMKASKSHIVNISSMGGFQGSVKFAGLSAYSTSKAALVSFTELFSEEYKESSIAMNCLCLGAVQTEMLADAFPGYEAPLTAIEMADFIGDFALKGNNYFRGKIIPVSLSTP